MKTQIKNRFTGSVIHEGDYASIYEAVATAIKSKTDLRDADLRDADLRGADLCCADLGGADLGGADLRDADLRDADLRGADLCCADLRCADLRGADLRGADLRGADLRCADLCCAKYATLIIAQTRILPDGEIIGWKKLQNGSIAKLRIPESAKRSNAFGRKCRCSEAIVVAIYDGDNEVDVGFSSHDPAFEYKKGEIVRPKKPFSEDWQDECASGIHFFITREEAENY